MVTKYYVLIIYRLIWYFFQEGSWTTNKSTATVRAPTITILPPRDKLSFCDYLHAITLENLYFVYAD